MQKATTPPRTNISEYDSFARAYYERLIGGEVQKDEAFPEDELRGWSIHFRPAYDCYQIDLEEIVPGEFNEDELADFFAKAGQSAAQSFKQQRNVNVNLDELLRSPLITDDGDITAEPASMPALPDIAKLDYSKGAHCKKWLDDWVDYAGGILDKAPRIHLMGTGLWVISAIIARRVLIKGLMNRTYHPNLYIALTSKSSTGKSSIAELGVKAITDLGLANKLILEGNWSPQILTQRAAGKPDAAYANMDENERAEEEERMIYSGRQSWFFDEFGKFLLKLNSQGGNSQQTQRLAELLLSWFSGKGVPQGSLTYGTDRIKDVYLSIIGCMTISNVKIMQKFGSAFWEDGMFSRIISLCPPHRRWQDVKISTGEEQTPDHILDPLRELHKWLSDPEGKIIEKDAPGGSKVYKLERIYYPEFHCIVPKDVLKMYENYYNAIGRLASDDQVVPSLIESSYKRLPEHTLKIAVLLACISNRGILKAEHWIAAQEIMEEEGGWRQSIHEFYEQVFQPEDSKERKAEDKVYKVIERESKKGKWVTLADIRRVTRLSASESGRILEELERRKMIVSCLVNHAKHPNEPTLKYAIKRTPYPLNVKLPE